MLGGGEHRSYNVTWMAPATSGVMDIIHFRVPFGRCIYEGGKVRLPSGEAWAGEPAGDLKPGESVELVVRPESLVFAPDGLPGRVTERRYAGPVSYFQVALNGQEVEVMAPSNAAAEGDAVSVGLGNSGPRPRIFGVGKA